MTHPHWSKRAVAALLLVLTLALLQPVVKSGIASLYYFPAAFRLEQWEKSTDKPAVDDLQRVSELVSNALNWQPNNPHYLLVKAKVDEWRWYSGVLETRQISANEQLYQRAITLRPDWPLAYADYAYFLSAVQLRLTDAWQQLALARHYGPFLPEVQEKYLSVAFSNWQSLTIAQKAEVYQYLEVAMAGSLQYQTRRLVQRFNMQKQICQYFRVKQKTVATWDQLKGSFCARFG